SVANRDRDSNAYTYFDTETFTDAKSCANAEGPSYSAAAPVAFKFARSIRGYKPPSPVPETRRGSHRHAQCNAFRPRDELPQSRSFAHWNSRLRRSRNSTRLYHSAR